MDLMIIQINGQPVSVGDVVTLASGEPIELTPSSFVTLTVGIAVDESVFSAQWKTLTETPT